MAIWSAEIKELEKLYESFRGQLPELEKELGKLTKADDENMILLYSRRCLEVIITDLCECELKRERGTEPLKGIIDKLNKERKVPSNIITSMDHLNGLSAYGAHPKEFDPEQVKPVLVNLDIIIKWYLKYKNLQSSGKTEQVELKSEATQQIVSPPEKSIIVLPFENISPDPDQEYFSDGLTEEIITDLSHIHELLVISRNSAMTFKGSGKTTKEITEKVNVRYVLEGSVRKAGNNLRITAQLIDAVTDTHLWAEKYSGTLGDVFDIQEKVSRSIANELKAKLSPEENNYIAKKLIADAQAYDLLLKSRKESLKGTPGSLEAALQLINDGLKLIGENELLYGALGYIYLSYFNFGINQDDSILNKVKEFSNKIFALNSTSFMGHFLLAMFNWKQGDLQNAILEYKKTLSLNPNHIDSLIQITYFYSITGKISVAKPYLARLIKISPLDWLTHFVAGWLYFAEGKFEDGLRSLSEMYQLDPENTQLKFYLGHGLAYNRKNMEAIKLYENINDEPDILAFSQFSSFFKYCLQNKEKDALRAVTEDLERFAGRDELFPLWMAEGYALIDQKKKSIDWLETLLRWGFINYPFLNTYDPFLENIRGEECFKKLMEWVKYEWENFEV